MVSLAVQWIGGGATLQDLGRAGFRRFGVPVGGAFDRESAAIGNSLVGNDAGAPALEMILTGGRFQVQTDCVATYVGADAPIEIDGRAVRPWTRLELQTGEVLAIGPMQGGCRGYLCVAGGFEAEAVLGSVSGEPVIKGDVLRLGQPKRKAPRSVDPVHVYGRGTTLHLLSGPQRASFDSLALTSAPYEVSTHSNRVGVRLMGLSLGRVEEAPSEPMCVGAVQVTGDGQPIIVGPDGPTIGGYPKIGVVADADTDLVARLVPGEQVRFAWVSAEEARRLREERNRRLAAL